MQQSHDRVLSYSQEPFYRAVPLFGIESLVSCKMSLEGGIGFSYKMSLEEGTRMLGVDDQRAGIGTIEPGTDSGVFGRQ